MSIRSAPPRLTVLSAEVSLGHLLMAASDRGVCFLGLAREPAALAADLTQTFPGYTPGADTARAHEWLATIESLVEKPSASTPAPPLDLRGTAFQRAVWEAMRHIPMGETRSYGQLANAIGQPSASRAVAGACGANPVGIIVPCHRVVRADGRIGGYHWGPEIKQALLLREGARHAASDGLIQ